MTMKTRCSTEVEQRKMNRPINSGKRVESIDRVDRFSVELSRFVRLDRFQGLPTNSVKALKAQTKAIKYLALSKRA